MINSPTDRKKIKDALQEMSNSMARVEGEKDLQKNIVNDIHDQYKLPKGMFKRMSRTYHRQNFQNEQQEHEEFENLYIEVVEFKQNP